MLREPEEDKRRGKKGSNLAHTTHSAPALLLSVLGWIP